MVTLDDEFFYGKEYADKKALFASGLLKIQSKYIDWFRMRKQNPNIRDQKHDMLHNHYVAVFSNPTVFNFFPESDLPERIRIECKKLFLKCFPTAN